MREGEKRRIYVHPELGYGTAGHLPPNSLLIFDIEVLTAGTEEQLNGSSIAESEEGAPSSAI